MEVAELREHQPNLKEYIFLGDRHSPSDCTTCIITIGIAVCMIAPRGQALGDD